MPITNEAGVVVNQSVADDRGQDTSIRGLGIAEADNFPPSGVGNPVTAVLLNFRAYDTLLEVAVLLAAVFAVLPVTQSCNWLRADTTTRSDSSDVHPLDRSAGDASGNLYFMDRNQNARRCFSSVGYPRRSGDSVDTRWRDTAQFYLWTLAVDVDFWCYGFSLCGLRRGVC